MNRLPRLDFAHSAADARKQQRLVLAVFGMLLGIELGLIAWQYQEIEGAQVHLADERLRLAKRLKQAPVTVISKALNERLVAAQGMVNSLAIPWEGLLSTLETAHEGKVTVESIRPDVAGRRVEIGALAANFSEISAFISRLSASSSLQQVKLLSETPSLDRQGSIRFVLTAIWAEVK